MWSSARHPASRGRAISERRLHVSARVVAKEDECAHAPDAPAKERNGGVLQGVEEARAPRGAKRVKATSPAEKRQRVEDADEQRELPAHGWRPFRQRLRDGCVHGAPPRFVEGGGVRNHRYGNRTEGRLKRARKRGVHARQGSVALSVSRDVSLWAKAAALLASRFKGGTLMRLMQRIRRIAAGAGKPFVRIPRKLLLVPVEEGSMRPGQSAES